MSITLNRPASLPPFFSGLSGLGFIFGFTLFLVNVLTSSLDKPIWLDETFSVTIAVQPDVGGLIDWCLNELSGPFYYSLLWAWEKVAGDGNAALRIPSLIFSVAAVAVLLWKGHEDRTMRTWWALCVALWDPGFAFTPQARPYMLMLFLGCVQAICFLNLLRAPTTRRAAIWAGVSSLAVLTHYHAMVISGLQGIAFLLIWRHVALRTWPALLVLVPMAGWMSLHLPLVLHYANSGTWYPMLDWRQALIVPLFLCGTIQMAAVVAFLILATLRARSGMAQAARASFALSPEMVVVATGLVATLIVVGVGLMRPSFSLRYLLPYVGAVFLLVPLLLRAVKPTRPFAPILIMVLMIGSAASSLKQKLKAPTYSDGYGFSFERPSAWIMQRHHVRKVVLLWDGPTALFSKPRNLADVGGFFFRRAGRPVEVLIPRYALNADPYPAVLSLADDRTDTAVIWAFDTDAPNTSALRHPPGVLRDTARWTCRDFGAGSITVLACLPRIGARSQSGQNTLFSGAHEVGPAVANTPLTLTPR